MKTKSTCQSAFFNLRVLLSLIVLITGAVLTLFAKTNSQALFHEDSRNPNPNPVTPIGGVQEAWVTRYNGPGNYIDDAVAIVVDNSGNVYVTGRSVGSDFLLDYATIKYNALGQNEWIARYDGPEHADDEATAIAIDDAGNVYATGASNNSDTSWSCATVKYNSAGQQQWVARHRGPAAPGSEPTAVAVDESGNVYVTGWSSAQDGHSDYVTIKYNSAGQEQWVAGYNGPGDFEDKAVVVAVDSSGNVYITGESYDLAFNLDYATIKYNSAGQEQWVARYNGPKDGEDGAVAIAADSAGNAYVTGRSSASDSGLDYATIKYDSGGTEQWVARYNGSGNFDDYAASIALDGAGNVYVTGASQGLSVFFDYATIKYDSAGQQQWVARYDGPTNLDDGASAIAIDGSGNVYVTGASLTPAFDYATVKYNSAGQEEWVARYDGPKGWDDYANAIALDNSGNVYVTGESTGSGTDYDYATIKYVQGPTPTPSPSPTPTATPRAIPRLRPTPRIRPTPH